MKTEAIGFKTKNGVEIVQPSEIIFCIAKGSYTKVVTSEKQFIVAKNLSQIEKKCCFKQFFRSHKSYLVNTKFIQRIHEDKVELRNYPEYALISRRKYKEIFIALKLSNITIVS